MPNFVRCHLCVIHLLDRIAKLPTMKVYVNDEGKYGRSYYTDDPWAEKRVYTWHDGKYDVKALMQEIGEWNEMKCQQGNQGSSAEYGSHTARPVSDLPKHLPMRQPSGGAPVVVGDVNDVHMAKGCRWFVLDNRRVR